MEDLTTTIILRGRSIITNTKQDLKGSEGAYLQHIIESRLDELALLCRRYHVHRLEVFGSVTTDRFNPETSDLDFLVKFEDMDPKNYADAYFGLLKSLEELFAKQIDLVSARAIRNPYFAEGVDATRQLVYAS